MATASFYKLILRLIFPQLFLYLLMFCSGAYAANEAEIKHHRLNLETKQKLIQLVQEKIKKLRTKETSTEQNLRELELKLAGYTKKAEKLTVEGVILKNKLKILNQEIELLKAKAESQRLKLARHLLFSYFIGRPDLFSTLFNKVGNKQQTRALALHKYMRDQHATLLKERLDSLARLDLKINQTAQKNKEIQNNLAKQKELTVNTNQDLKQRAGILASLQNSLKNQTHALNKHKSDAKDLAELIQQLEVAIGSLPIEIRPDVAFGKLKGKLPSPVKSKRPSRLTDLKGVIFQAKPGTEVYAVAGGRVVFADWLRGYGLLVIIDHGDGYMSLYGKTQSLYREKGEWVNAGDLLARVGDTGGFGKPGLYFDIRLKGKSVKVLAWL